MAQLQINHLTFAYPGHQEPALEDITLTVEEGEFLLLCGASGCGKTTLLRHLKTALTPHGTRSGEILLDGTPLDAWDARTQTQRIGYVMQHPDDQLVTDQVWHELAFGLESLGTDQQTMRLRVGEMASYFGIQSWFHRAVKTLSGGQKQLLNLASVMAMAPDILILDEPTSQLDPIAAADFLNTLKKLNRELGVTMILTEHRLEEALPMADRVAVLGGGRLQLVDTPQGVARHLQKNGDDLFQAMPTPIRVWGGLGAQGECPMDVRQGRAMLARWAPQFPEQQESVKQTTSQEKPAVEMKECWFRYDKNGEDILRGLSLTVLSGEIYALVGGNGTGKSTTLSVLAGQYPIYRGKIKLFGETVKQKDLTSKLGVAALCQDPRAMFVGDTVGEDLQDQLDGLKLSPQEGEARLHDAVAAMALEEYLDAHPFDLSGGEQQRAAIAKVLLAQPKLLLLDEPTKGMDAAFKTKFGHLLQGLSQRGVTIILVSHDIEFCAKYAHRCGLCFNGEVLASQLAKPFFAGNHFYTTAANRMARRWAPQAILTEEVIALWKTADRRN